MFNDDNAGNGGNKYVSCWRKCLMLAKMFNAGNPGDGGENMFNAGDGGAKYV